MDTNDAAERLRRFIQTDEPYERDRLIEAFRRTERAAERRAYFDELMVAGLIGPKGLTFDAAKQAADAMEERVVAVTRRATVERIRAGLYALGRPGEHPGAVWLADLDVLLDAVAER